MGSQKNKDQEKLLFFLIFSFVGECNYKSNALKHYPNTKYAQVVDGLIIVRFPLLYI